MKKISIIFLSEEPKKTLLTKSTNETPAPESLQKGETLEEEFVRVPKGFLEQQMKQNELLMQLVQSSGVKLNGGGADNSAILAKEIVKSLKDINENSSTRMFGGTPVDQDDIDPEDILSPPAMLFTYSFKYAIYDDVRNGRAIQIPVGAVKFHPLHRSVTGSGGRGVPSYSNTSVALIFSKKQLKWLIGENGKGAHSLFGIKFFLNASSLKNVKQAEADRLATAYSTVQALSGYALRTRCITEGIDIDTVDESQLRRKLVEKIADKIRDEEISISKRNVEKQFESKGAVSKVESVT